MWKKLTERAQASMHAAELEARAYGHTSIRSEHILLALVRDSESTARNVLYRLGISADRLRAQIEPLMARRSILKVGEMTLSEEGLKIIELAEKEARWLGDESIGTGHYLLAVILEGNGIGAKALASLKVGRFAVREAIEGRTSGTPQSEGEVAYHSTMWQRFTEGARKVIFYSQEEAQRYGELYVSTEHLLLGLLRDQDSVAVKVLIQLGFQPGLISETVQSLLPRREALSTQYMTLTPRGKRVIDLSYDEARKLGHNYIGTEHLLFALIREADGLGGRILAKVGVQLDSAHAAYATLYPEQASAVKAQSEAENARAEARPYRESQMTALNRRRMPADSICLILLVEAAEPTVHALRDCGGDLETALELIEQEFLDRRSSEEIEPGFPSVSDLLAQAASEASALGQDLNPVHFLLAAFSFEKMVTPKALEATGVTLDKLRTWAAENP